MEKQIGGISLNLCVLIHVFYNALHISNYETICLQRYPNSIKFRYKPLPLEDKLDILFNEKAATGEFQYTSSSGKMPSTDDFVDCYTPILESDGEGTKEDEDVVIVDPKELGKRKASLSSG